MRLAGKLDDQHDAATLIDYLLTLGIAAKAERQAAGWDLWIFDEDQLAKGREEIAAFQADPKADRYRNAGAAAEKIRREKAERELAARRNLVETNPNRRPRANRPLTIVLLSGMAVVSIFSDFGKDRKFLAPLFMERAVVVEGKVLWPQTPLDQTLRLEPWRLFTPIFIHYSVSHFVFNAVTLFSFGTLIESLRKTWRFALLVLFLATVSNLAEYWWEHRQGQIANFGGMSGVCFGLFGYVWMKAWNEPWSGFYMSNQSIVFMFIFHLLCMSGAMGNIANAAHIGGQIAGMAAGIAPTLLGFSQSKQ
jgi:GlpG protein